MGCTVGEITWEMIGRFEEKKNELANGRKEMIKLFTITQCIMANRIVINKLTMPRMQCNGMALPCIDANEPSLAGWLAIWGFRDQDQTQTSKSEGKVIR